MDKLVEQLRIGDQRMFLVALAVCATSVVRNRSDLIEDADEALEEIEAKAEEMDRAERERPGGAAPLLTPQRLHLAVEWAQTGDPSKPGRPLLVAKVLAQQSKRRFLFMDHQVELSSLPEYLSAPGGDPIYEHSCLPSERSTQNEVEISQLLARYSVGGQRGQALDVEQLALGLSRSMDACESPGTPGEAAIQGVYIPKGKACPEGEHTEVVFTLSCSKTVSLPVRRVEGSWLTQEDVRTTESREREARQWAAALSSVNPGLLSKSTRVARSELQGERGKTSDVMSLGGITVERRFLSLGALVALVALSLRQGVLLTALQSHAKDGNREEPWYALEKPAPGAIAWLLGAIALPLGSVIFAATRQGWGNATVSLFVLYVGTTVYMALAWYRVRRSL